MSKGSTDYVSGISKVEPLRVRSSLAELIREDYLGETVFEIADESDEAGKKKVITVSRRDMLPEQPTEPRKVRSPRRSHVFHDIQSVLEYAKKTKSGHGLVIADCNSLSATYVIDESAPDGFESVTYKPMLHPLLSMWLGGPWRALAFAQFLLENRSIVLCGEDENGKRCETRDIVFAFRQIRTSKNVTVEAGAGKKAINGVMCEMKIASSAEVQQVQLALPERITISCPIFVSSQEDDELTFDLFIYNDDQRGVMVSATNSELKTMIIKEFDQQINAVRTDLEKLGITLAFGECSYQPWDVLPTLFSTNLKDHNAIEPGSKLNRFS
jgi:hypothetical protein